MLELENSIYYFDVFVTPIIRQGNQDDFQPRICITKAFKDGEIFLENRQAIQNFAFALACEEKHTVNYIQHIKDIEIGKEERSREREAAN